MSVRFRRRGVCVCTRIFFFFQAEDGIRDLIVTGVQTCALPISLGAVVTGLLAGVLVGLASLVELHAKNAPPSVRRDVRTALIVFAGSFFFAFLDRKSVV